MNKSNLGNISMILYFINIKEWITIFFIGRTSFKQWKIKRNRIFIIDINSGRHPSLFLVPLKSSQTKVVLKNVTDIENT